MPIKKGTSIKAGSKEWSSIKRAASARPSRDTHMTPTASRGDSLAEPAIEDFGVFRAKLLGSVTVDAATDAGVVVAATTKIKKDKGHDPRKVYLNVTSSELQVLDQSSNDVIQTSDVGQVIFFAIHPKDKKTLCYITKSKYGVLHAHVFQVKEKAKEIQTGIKFAMEAYQQYSVALGDTAAANAAADAADDAARSKSSSDLKAFDAFYLGFQTVDKPRGNDVVNWALDKNDAYRKEEAKRAGKGASKVDALGDPVTLLLTPESIRTVERLSGETLMNDFIKHVTFSSNNERNGNEIFSYIYNEERLNQITCHIFSVPFGQGKIIRSTLKEMVQVGTENSRSQGNNPFSALPNAPREVPTGELFKKQIHRADLKAVHVIGAGQYGEVYLALQTARKPSHMGGGIVALKRAVKMVRNNATREDKKEFLRESNTQLMLDHESLVKMVGVAVQQAPWLCVLEFCEHGDLRAVVRACKEKGITVAYDEQLNMCQQLAGGMAHLTSKRLVHMDLAARNCLLAHGNIVKVADFGLTRPLDRGKDTLTLRERLKLPLKWVALEGLDDKIFGEYSDCWSFGVLVWELLSYGETPYPYIKTPDIQDKIREGTRLEMPRGTPPKFWAIVSKCWNANPLTRWKFANLQVALRGLIPEAPETPMRDLGVFLKSGGKDTGVNGSTKVITARESIKAPSEASKLGAAATQAPDPNMFKKTAYNQNPSVRGTPQQAMHKMRQAGGRAAQAAPPIQPQAAPRAPGPTPAQRPAISGVRTNGSPDRTGADRSPATAPVVDVGPGDIEGMPEPAAVLEQLNLVQYVDNLVTEGITKFMFANCDDDMLTEIGITNEKHRQIILGYFRRIKMNAKMAQAKALREGAAQRRQLAPQLQDSDPEVRRAARTSVSGMADAAKAPDWMAQRQAKLMERQKSVTAARMKREAAETGAQQRRNSAVDANMKDANAIAKKRAAEKEAAEKKAAAEAAAAEEASRRKKEEEEAHRSAHLKAQRQKQKELEAKSANVGDVSEQAARAVAPRRPSAANIFAKAPEEDEWGKGKSKIWKALNPRPLAYESPRQKAERAEGATVMDPSSTGRPDYAFLSDVKDQAAAAAVEEAAVADGDDMDDFEDDDLDGFAEVDGPPDPVQEVVEEEESEEEEEDVDPASLGGLDSDFMKTMAANRAKREKEEEERKAKLRAQHAAKQKIQDEVNAKELAIIRAEQAIEKKKKEEQKDKDVAEAKARMATELTFDFSFG